MSNSSAISDWPMWAASAGCPSMGGSSRAPAPSSEEGGDVVVEDHQQHVGPLLGDPRLQGREGLEDRGPHRVVPLVAVEGEADGGGVRCGNAADDLGHGWLLLSCHES
jgi:hypothetical protein